MREESDMLKARTHFEQVSLAAVKKIIESTGQRITPLSEKKKKKIFARHPKVQAKGNGAGNDAAN